MIRVRIVDFNASYVNAENERKCYAFCHLMISYFRERKKNKPKNKLYKQKKEIGVI